MIIEDNLTPKSPIFSNLGVINSLSENIFTGQSLFLKSYRFDNEAKERPTISKEIKIETKVMLKETIFSIFEKNNSPKNQCHLVVEVSDKVKGVVIARVVFLNSKVKDNTELNALARSIKMISMVKKSPPNFLFSTIPASYLPKNSYLV